MNKLRFKINFGLFWKWYDRLDFFWFIGYFRVIATYFGKYNISKDANWKLIYWRSSFVTELRRRFSFYFILFIYFLHIWGGRLRSIKSCRTVVAANTDSAKIFYWQSSLYSMNISSRMNVFASSLMNFFDKMFRCRLMHSVNSAFSPIMIVIAVVSIFIL